MAPAASARANVSGCGHAACGYTRHHLLFLVTLTERERTWACRARVHAASSAALRIRSWLGSSARARSRTASLSPVRALASCCAEIRAAPIGGLPEAFEVRRAGVAAPRVRAILNPSGGCAAVGREGASRGGRSAHERRRGARARLTRRRRKRRRRRGGVWRGRRRRRGDRAPHGASDLAAPTTGRHPSPRRCLCCRRWTSPRRARAAPPPPSRATAVTARRVLSPLCCDRAPRCRPLLFSDGRPSSCVP